MSIDYPPPQTFFDGATAPAMGAATAYFGFIISFWLIKQLLRNFSG